MLIGGNCDKIWVLLPTVVLFRGLKGLFRDGEASIEMLAEELFVRRDFVEHSLPLQGVLCLEHTRDPAHSMDLFDKQDMSFFKVNYIRLLFDFLLLCYPV